jgi:hypothetical protein
MVLDGIREGRGRVFLFGVFRVEFLFMTVSILALIVSIPDLLLDIHAFCSFTRFWGR